MSGKGAGGGRERNREVWVNVEEEVEGSCRWVGSGNGQG